MNTVGKLLTRERLKKKISISRLSEKTKIKKHFLQAIEKEEWRVLPNFAVAQGFVRNIAGVLGTNPEIAVALLRRDFEESKEDKSAHLKKSLWTPKTTIIVIALLITSILGFYLFRQYLSFVAPPPLSVNEVKREGNLVKINGKTDSEAQILINNEPLFVKDDGTFSITLTQVNTGEKLTIESRSRSGHSNKKEIIIP